MGNDTTCDYENLTDVSFRLQEKNDRPRARKACNTPVSGLAATT